MSRSRNERGDIGTVVAILVGIVAILVVGGLAWQAKQTNTGKTTATATPTVAPTGTPVADHTATQALAKVQEFYAAYLKNPVETVAKPYVADDYLAQLYSQKSYDPVLCTQGGSDQPLRYANSSSDAMTAKVQIKQLYKGSNQDNVIDVDVRLSDLKVTKISCHL
jgi:hypothetical protein